MNWLLSLVADLLLVRAAAGKDELDIRGVGAVLYSLQQRILVLLAGKAANADDHIRLIFVRYAHAVVRDQAVGNHTEVAGIAIGNETVSHILSGTLDNLPLVKAAVLPNLQHQLVRESPTAHSQRIEDILRMKVIGTGDGLTQLAGNPGRSDFQHKRLFHMHHIGPANSLLHYFGVGAAN